MSTTSAATITTAPYKFTGKERDSESGLDNFGARYFSSQFGRMMSPDPIFASPAHLTDPQMWNEYAYVRNNPLSMTDPTGLDMYLSCTQNDGNQNTCQQNPDDNTHGYVQGQMANGSFVATDVDMNKQGDPSAGYHDQWGNQYTGSFDENNGVSFTNTATGVTSTQSVFIDGSDPTQVNGTPGLAFEGVTGNFQSNCGGSCEGSATLTGNIRHAMDALHQESRLADYLDVLITGAHGAGPQWSGPESYARMLLQSSGMEMHFETHPPGRDLVNTVLHLVDAIKDRASGRAAEERDRPRQ
jgi:RHS repeat-associated protein